MLAGKHRFRPRAGALTQFILGAGLLISGVNSWAAEGGASLLDNSMILFGSSLKDGNRHIPKNLPLILAGRGKGTLRPGRRLRAQPDSPFCNLHLALLQRMGIKLASFGDSTGPLDGLA